ncbi:MAG TPA: TauD/TfdA family dioxygenase, partial [Rhizomicrobium sp.]
MIQVEPLTPVIGAEIYGVDLCGPLSEEQFAEIHSAFIRHHVLVFRDQHLTPEAHKHFARMFGRLHVHPYHAKSVSPDHAKSELADPEILEVRADKNSRNVAGEEWHTD